MPRPRRRPHADPTRRPPNPTPAERPDDRRAWGIAVLVVALLVATGLRLVAVEKASFWLDELWTLELADGHGTAHERVPTGVLLASPPSLTALAAARPIAAVWTTLAEVTHPPLYFLLLRAWREAVGGSDVAARLLPLLASVAAVGLIYRVARDAGGPRAAAWAALLLAVAGPHVYFAQEVRSYSLLVALSLAAAAALLAVERRGATWGRSAAFAGCVLAMLLTHYFAVGVALGLAGYAALRLPRRELARVAAALAVAAVVYAVCWGPFFLAQRGAFAIEGAGGATFVKDADPSPLRAAALRLISLPAQALVGGDLGDRTAEMTPARLVWPALAAVLAPIAWARRAPGLLLWYLWVAGALLPLAVLDVTRSSMHLAFPRYTNLATVGVYGVLATGYLPVGSSAFAALTGAPVNRARRASRVARVAGFLVPGAAVVLAATAVPTAWSAVGRKPDWEPMLSVAAESAASGDPIVYAAEGDNGRIVYLYAQHVLSAPPGPGAGSPAADHPAALLDSPPSPDLLRQLRAAPPCWVVYVGTPRGLAAALPGAQIDVRAGVPGTAVFGRVVWQAAATP